MRTARRISVKLGLLVVAALLLIFLADSILFQVVGRNGWMYSGPNAAWQPFIEWWRERFGQVPSTDDGFVLAPLVPPHEYPAQLIYRAEQAAPGEAVDAPDGLIMYAVGGGPRVPLLPPFPSLLQAFANQPVVPPQLVHGAAFVSSEGELWCRMDVAVPFRFRTREFVGTTDQFMPPASAKGWRTARIDVLMLGHNVAALLVFFGWPFFIRDVRAGFRRVRERHTNNAKRLPRPITIRAIGVRAAVLALASGALVLGLDSILFIITTHDGPRLVPSMLSSCDQAWWRGQVGVIPAETLETIPPPAAIGARDGTWLIHRGGRGGDGPAAMAGPTAPRSLVAYSIEQHEPLIGHWSPLSGRALSGPDHRAAYRMGVRLPFVARERSYVGSSRDFAPSLADDRWNVQVRPIAFIGNVAIFILLFGWPIYLRDVRAIIRLLRGRCTSCGYSLQGLTSSRCPECGCEKPPGRTTPAQTARC